EIIKTYADGQRVILVDVRSQFLNSDGTFKGEMYLERNGDYPDMFLHLSAKGYREIMAPAISAAMAAAGASSVTLPALGDVAAQVSGTSATISISGVTKGTDANGVAASSYSVLAKLDTDAEATVLSGQSGATASFSLADLADGWHSCAAMVKTGDGMVSAPKRVKFMAASHANDPGWTSQPMDETGSPFRADGVQVFARGFTAKTAGGVSFASGFPSSSQATVSPSSYSGEGWGANNPVFNGGWAWSKSGSTQDLVFTLKGLTAGRRYVVQILAANHWNDSETTISAGDLTPIVATKTNGYKYGAVLSQVFDASAAEKTITISFSGSNSKCLVKAIQLRELGDGSGGSGGEGGGGEGGGAAVAALANQTAASASFQIADLADGSYTCEVTITTDKGKTATKTASFVVSTSGQGGGGSVEEGWTVGPMAADGSTIRTDGTLLYAYSSPGGTVGGVPFARAVSLGAASMVSASPASAGNSGGSFGDGGATGDFGNMLGTAGIGREKKCRFHSRLRSRG
nr:SGNH/GDSL hydrolase family protein [Kiritimatiellia bacterium]